MTDDIEIQQENYRRYKRGETIIAWTVTCIIILGIVITIFPKKRYPQADANGNAVTHTCTTDVLRMPDFPPVMTPLCISKDQR